MDRRRRETRERSQQEIVKGILEGDEQSFSVLYDRYWSRVYAYAIKRVGNPVDAEDIAQEVFLQIHRSMGSYQGRSSLSTWIFGIAHNVTCRHFRGGSHRDVALEASDTDARLSEAPRHEPRLDAAHLIERCDGLLARVRGREHQQIFQLFYGCGRPLRSIARTMGKSTETIKDSLRRSRNMLRRDLPEIGLSLAALTS